MLAVRYGHVVSLCCYVCSTIAMNWYLSLVACLRHEELVASVLLSGLCMPGNEVSSHVLVLLSEGFGVREVVNALEEGVGGAMGAEATWTCHKLQSGAEKITLDYIIYWTLLDYNK